MESKLKFSHKNTARLHSENIRSAAQYKDREFFFKTDKQNLHRWTFTVRIHKWIYIRQFEYCDYYLAKIKMSILQVYIMNLFYLIMLDNFSDICFNIPILYFIGIERKNENRYIKKKDLYIFLLKKI